MEPNTSKSQEQGDGPVRGQAKPGQVRLGYSPLPVNIGSRIPLPRHTPGEPLDTLNEESEQDTLPEQANNSPTKTKIGDIRGRIMVPGKRRSPKPPKPRTVRMMSRSMQTVPVPATEPTLQRYPEPTPEPVVIQKIETYRIPKTMFRKLVWFMMLLLILMPLHYMIKLGKLIYAALPLLVAVFALWAYKFEEPMIRIESALDELFKDRSVYQGYWHWLF